MNLHDTDEKYLLQQCSYIKYPVTYLTVCGRFETFGFGSTQKYEVGIYCKYGFYILLLSVNNLYSK